MHLIEFYSDKIEIIKDDMDNAVYTYPLSRYEEAARTELFCWFYIVEVNDTACLLLEIGFHRDNWLFMEKIKLKSGDNEINLTVSSRQRDTNVFPNASIAEVTRFIIDDPFPYNDMVDEAETQIRFYGRQSNMDFTLSVKQKSDMETIIGYYLNVIL